MVGKTASLPTFSFDNDPVSYVAPSWTDLESACIVVAQQVKQSGLAFDVIVTLAKGGWPMTRSLSDFTGIGEIASIGVKFYSGINQKADKPIIYQDLPTKVKGKRVLLFDDVADSGGSLQFVRDLLHQRGAKSVKTATLYYKPHSIVKPDYFGGTTSAWIIFPFEIVEMSDLLRAKWGKHGALERDIQARLNKMKLLRSFDPIL